MTLRTRTAVSMIGVVAAYGAVATFVGGYFLRRHVGLEAENRVRQDLNAAEAFYRQHLAEMQSVLRYTALGERFRQAVAERDLAYLSARLAAMLLSARLDVLCVTDAAGRVIARANNEGLAGDSLADHPLVRPVLTGRDAASGTILVPIEALERESSALARRARMPIVATPRARPSESTHLAAGMMQAASVAVHDPDGRLAGVLLTGTLLNQDYDLVDQVRNTVFRDEQYGGKGLGTATIFQDDVRISTNVLHEDGTRAVGSRVSAEVYDRVLRHGQTWLGRAWVVNDWYISAYTPIRDVGGRAIGMLCVGVLEAKYRGLTARTLAVFGGVALAGLVVAMLVAWKLADGISRPVSRLAKASDAIRRGHFPDALPVDSTGEIGALTRTFNEMAWSIRERDALLKEQTRLQLTRSERLASIGRLAAGVAHEINNPLTGVLTFAHMLLQSLPEGSRDRADVQTIIDATVRCRDIVRGLLNFSRQNEPRKSLADLNAVLRQALDLTRNQAAISRISTVEAMDPNLPHVVLDANQIQEVAVNVIVNAIDAMPDGGRLTVRTRAGQTDGARWVEFEIADTGCGIPETDRDRVFDPFFTTKQTGKGTGLGLAVSYGIVTEHGGRIDVASEVGRGTTVTVRLPLEEREPADEREAENPGG